MNCVIVGESQCVKVDTPGTSVTMYPSYPDSTHGDLFSDRNFIAPCFPLKSNLDWMINYTVILVIAKEMWK